MYASRVSGDVKNAFLKHPRAKSIAHSVKVAETKVGMVATMEPTCCRDKLLSEAENNSMRSTTQQSGQWNPLC